MAPSDPRANDVRPHWLRRIGRIVLFGVLVLAGLCGIGWAALALSLDGPGGIGVIVYLLATVALIVFVRPRRRGFLAASALFALIVAWWLTIEPRNDRVWLKDVDQLSTARIEGERLTVSNVRNFKYTSETEFVPQWEERTYDLSKLTGVDLAICDWGAGMIVHTMVSWEFADSAPLIVSIETRKEAGEGYSAVRGCFRQFELYYVVGDERDLIGLRTNFRGERVRLYRLANTPAEARGVLEAYVTQINELAAEPVWYNAFTHNCTTSIRLHASQLGIEQPWNWRILINGYSEELLYMREQVNVSLPFEELRAQSDVTERAKAAGTSPDFSEIIRDGLPPRPAIR